MKKLPRTLLAGDVGGTTTALGIFNPQQGLESFSPIRFAQYRSREFASLEEILQLFMQGQPEDIELACFDVAGPVVDGRSRITNLPWVVERASLMDHLQAPVVLINDMEAVAMAVAHADAIRTAVLQPGHSAQHGRRAVLAPGTGLGEGFLVWSQDRCLTFGTEGGHTDFGPRTPLQSRLLAYLQDKFGHISYERVCSGIGIQNLYAFFKESEGYPEPDWLRRELEGTLDSTPAIIQAALQDKAPICSAVLDLFVEILGGEAGNIALKILANGGVYLAGGLPRRMLAKLQTPTFLNAFCAKGRMDVILSQIPLHVVLEPEAALLGAAWTGIEALAGSHAQPDRA